MSEAASLNQDFLDVLTALVRVNAEFVVVGAHALGVHGHPRATGDLDMRCTEAHVCFSGSCRGHAAGRDPLRRGVDVAAFALPGYDIADGGWVAPGGNMERNGYAP